MNPSEAPMKKQTEILSPHAKQRSDQRGQSHDKIENAIRYGDSLPVGKGDAAFFISKRCAKRFPAVKEHEGVLVIVTGEGVVKTVYRNRKLRPHDMFRRWNLDSTLLTSAPSDGREGICLN